MTIEGKVRKLLEKDVEASGVFIDSVKLEKEDKLTKKTKKYLKQVIKEAQEIEDSNNDPEIQKAIDGDIAFLNSEREKRRIRKEEKKKKKLEKRNK